MSARETEASIDDRMNLLARRATVVRSRLLRTVDALDARRHQVKKIGAQVKGFAVHGAIAALGIAAAVGLGVAMIGVALRRRRRRSLSYRASNVVERLNLGRRPSLRRRVFERVTLTVVTFAVTELAKRASKNALRPRESRNRLTAPETKMVVHMER